VAVRPVVAAVRPVVAAAPAVVAPLAVVAVPVAGRLAAVRLAEVAVQAV